MYITKGDALRQRTLPGRWVVIITLLLASVIAIPQSAQAATWTESASVPITGMQTDRTWAMAGGVLLADCSPSYSASTTTLRFVPNAGAQTSWETPRTAPVRPEPCDIEPAFANDGTVYMPATTSSGIVLAAYHGAAPAWQRALPHGCGAIYALASTKSRVYALLQGCTQNKTYLIGVNPVTGVQELETALAVELPDSPPSKAMAAYSGGLVLVHKIGIQYVRYNGTPQPAVTIPGILLPHRITADTAGRTWLPIQAPPAARQICGGNESMAARLESYSPLGKISQTPALTCAYVHAVTTLTDGSALAELWPHGTASAAAHQLVAFTPGGDTRWAITIPEADSYGHKPQLRFAVLQNGDIVLTRNATQAGRNTMRIELHDAATGTLLEPAFDYAGPDTNYVQTGSADIPATMPGSLYLPLRTCTGGNCATSLHHLQRTELDWAYPGPISEKPGDTQSGLRQYVALGDSFSSGEGVQPFDPDTDKHSGDKNLCHRSAQAYPQLLGKNKALGLYLDEFKACSGATTGQVHHGWPQHKNKKDDINLNERPQARNVSQETDLVTITIGGNDVGFANVVTQCVLRLCEFAINNAYDKITPVTLGVRLHMAYRAIRNRMGPQTKVLVLGYPALLPPKQEIDRGCKWGQLSKLTSRQVKSLRRLGDTLNQMVAQETAKAGFTYVANTALDGHELCTAQPYINPVRVYPHSEYSVHPNAFGQRAIANLLAGRIKELYTNN